MRTRPSLLLILLLAACQGGVQNRAVVPDEPQNQTIDPALVAQLQLGTRLTVQAPVPLRGGPTNQDIIRETIPKGDVITIFASAEPNGNYLEVDHHGLTGWVLGTVLTVALSTYQAPAATVVAPPPGSDATGDGDGTTPTQPVIPPPATVPPTSQQQALARAQTGVGFSYWWGGGAWLSEGASTSNAGVCDGTCPSCTHAGTYGADCSGYLAKIWQVPDTNDDVAKDAHPYSTATFNAASSEWRTIDRALVQAADAYVYNSNGEGHIFLYSAGDAFGAAYTYEARGCATGIVYNLRTITSAYHPIRRAGW